MNKYSRTLQTVFLLGPRVLALRRIREKTRRGEEIGEEEAAEEARKLVEAFIKLAPTYIKFGQVLSVHSDVFPEPYLKELSKLQDQVPPAKWEEVEPYVLEDLRKLGFRVKRVEREPVSSASIAQVHLAELEDGRKVAIKVRRPRIEEVVRVDIEVMKSLSPLLKYVFDEAFYETIRVIINDFSRRIFEEMDFEKESFYMRKLEEELREFPDVRVPKLLGATKRVIVMEYLPGYKVTSEEAKRIVPPKELAYRVFRVFMAMLLEKEYFHADPHPGNIAVDEKGNLILYDYGMVGRLDKETRNRLLRVYSALVRLDAPMLVKALEELGAVDPTADRELLVRGLELFLKNFQGVTPETLEVETFIKAANEVFYRFPLRLPQSLVLYIRMTSLLGGTCVMIDPDFKFFDNLVKFIEERNLLLPAMIDEARSLFNDVLRKFKMSLLEKPVQVRREERSRDLAIVTAFLASLLVYFFLKDGTISILAALLGLALALRRA
ncbi:MAG: ABC1 kinase family protein [Thermoprotei archaeon]